MTPPGDSREDLVGSLLDQYGGEIIRVSFRELVGVLPADELTHGLFPYPARLLRAIPRLLLSSHSVVNEVSTILDPFCGSGTVLVEAQRAHHASVGVDVNPMAALISRVKTQRLADRSELGRVASTLTATDLPRRGVNVPAGVARWFSTESISVLSAISEAVAGISDSGIRDAMGLALAIAVRRASLADRRIAVPVLDRAKAPFSREETWAMWDKAKADVIARTARIPDGPSPRVILSDIREAQIGPLENPIVLTSPPYGTAQKYARSTWLESAWLGLASAPAIIDRASIGRERPDMNLDLEAVMSPLPPATQRELRRIAERDQIRALAYAQYFVEIRAAFGYIVATQPVKRMCLILGTNVVAGELLETHRHVSAILAGLGYQVRLVLEDEIRGRTLLTRRKRGAQPAKHEYVYILERQ